MRVRAIASEAGPRLFKFRVAPQSDELVAQNNVREALIQVRDVQDKILYFEGEPRFEMKFIRRAVADDKNLQVVALQRTADNKFLRLGVDGPGRACRRLPEDARRAVSYRGLILGSIEAGAFSGDQLQMIADFVDAGRRQSADARRRALVREGGYGGTPVADALPLVIDPAARASEPAELARLKIRPRAPVSRTRPRRSANSEAASARAGASCRR